MPKKQSATAKSSAKKGGAAEEEPLKVSVVPDQPTVDPETTKPENVDNRAASYTLPAGAVNQEDEE
jgi:hypothetical protein